jgi:hypothetical protein
MSTNFSLDKDVLAHLDENRVRHFHYVVKRLGFVEEETLIKFVERLYKSTCTKYKGQKYKVVEHNGRVNYYDCDLAYFALTTYKALTAEFRFKKGRFTEKNIIDENGISHYREGVYEGIEEYRLPKTSTFYISATDISSYIFCPASYCIQKTFKEVEVTEEAAIGTELHEQNRLVGFVPGATGKFVLTSSVTENIFYNAENKEFFDDINSSAIVYVGHASNEKKFFKSSRGKFVGQPDYIFRNHNGESYIVEEKYRSLKKEIHFLRDNHKAQLLSYIVGLDEFKAKYGYLVYWYYDYEGDSRKVKKCVVYRVEKADAEQLVIRKAYKEITSCNAGNALIFDASKLDFSKCANCVVSKFCGHKTGRFDEVTVPYKREFYTLI